MNKSIIKKNNFFLIKDKVIQVLLAHIPNYIPAHAFTHIHARKMLNMDLQTESMNIELEAKYTVAAKPM